MGTMQLKSFNQFFLSEAISRGSFDKAAGLITKYLTKKLGGSLFAYPFSELGYPASIRFFLPKNGLSFRINFTSSGSSEELTTLDFWKGEEKYTIKFDKSVSLVQVLPLIADIVNSGNMGGKIVYAASDENVAEAIELATDDITEAFTSTDLVGDVLQIMSKGEFTQNDIWLKLKAPGFKVYKEILIKYPKAVIKSGRKFKFTGGSDLITKIKQDENALLDGAGVVRGIVSTGAPEKVINDPELKKIEDEYSSLAFEEQLADLERLIKLVVVSQTSNALFVAGRGGIGKTHTVEQVLEDLGKKDGNGYFKNTGSISAAGLYMTLYRHRDSVILFDDTDDVFKDQTSRNILKAATDTKKKRKLVWNKQGSNVVDPSTLEDEGGDIDDSKIPRYFEFTGQIIFISNLSKEKLDPDGAIQTRSFLIDINPSDEEIYNFMEKIADKIPLVSGATLNHDQRIYVIKLLRNSKSKQTANLRKLSRGLNMYAGAIKAGVNVSDTELSRMIAMYA